MATRPKQDMNAPVVGEWVLPLGATLGSSVRAKGILLEIRARLPRSMRTLLDIEAGVLTMRASSEAEDEARAACMTVAGALDGIDALPVIPREIEDILSITASERYRWLKDGRLQSAGTRTVTLRGRARKITFHVFDPRHVEDVLDRDLVTLWREHDAMTAADNRRRAAAKAAMARSRKQSEKPTKTSGDSTEKPSRQLRGWEDFDSGLLK
jgi:hypothetical protein